MMIALVPAAGAGSRMQSDCPKQYLPLHGEPLIAHTLRALARESRIAQIVVVVSLDDAHWETYDWSEWEARLAGVALRWRDAGAVGIEWPGGVERRYVRRTWVLVNEFMRSSRQMAVG